MAKLKFKKKSFKSKSKRKFVRKQKKNVISRTLVSLGKGLPKKIMCTHKYVETTNLVSLAGNLAAANWSCNSLYDPNHSGLGHSVLYFDQMKAIYNHYTVIGSKIKITFAPPNAPEGEDSGINSTVIVGCMMNDDNSITGSINWTLTEQSRTVAKTICAGSTTPTIITRNFSAKKTFGGSVLGNDQLQGSATTSPPEQFYYTVYLQPYDIASTVSIYYMVEIEYIAIWDELKDVAGS